MKDNSSKKEKMLGFGGEVGDALAYRYSFPTNMGHFSTNR